MNDPFLRERMEGAVAGIRPASRLDQILAGPRAVPPKAAPEPPSRALLLAVAAAIAVIAGVTVALVMGNAGQEPSRLDVVPASTTTTVPADGARLGERVSILAATLPPGMRLIDETPRSANVDATRFTRFAVDDGRWNGDGPYLRISVIRGSGYEAYWRDSDRGAPFARVGGADVYRLVGQPGLPAESTEGWVTYSWATGPDELVEMQAKGIDDDTVLAIADSVVVEP